MWWTKSSDGEGLIRVSENRNCFFYTEKHSGSIGLRPCIVYSEIEPFITSSSIDNNDSENFKVTFGEYPQDVVEQSYADYLEKQYKNRKLKQTGKIYTTNGADLYEEEIFVPIKYLEYQARNSLKYIRYIYTKNDKYSLFDLKKDKVYWVRVKPIVWLVNKDNDIAIPESILVSGIPFDDRPVKYEDDYENTFIKKFLDNVFSNEILNQDISKKVGGTGKNKSADIDNIFSEALLRMSDIIDESDSKKIKQKR